MLYSEMLEQNVIVSIKDEMRNCENRDQINKLYRQARIWVRFHCYFAKGCSIEHSQKLNETFKKLRWDRLKEIEQGE